MVRVLAVDPGYGRAGVALIARESGSDRLLYSDCIETPAHTPLPERLNTVASSITSLLKRYRPTLLALEQLYLTRNHKTAMRVAEVRGAILALGAAAGISVVEYTPLEVKVAITGFGRSAKREVANMIPRLIELPRKPKRLDDEYDAIAIGLTALACYRP